MSGIKKSVLWFATCDLLRKELGLRLGSRRMPIEQLTVLAVKPPSEVVTPNLSAVNRAP